MFLPNSKNTAFIRSTSMYYYNVMLFGHKNAKATYQCIMSKMLGPLLGKTMKVFIDDILVKSESHSDHLVHMWEVF